MLTLITWQKVVSVKFSPLYNYSSPPHPPFPCGRKEVIMSSPHLRLGGYAPSPWGRNIYVNYLDLVCKGDLPLSLHLLIYSVIYINMGWWVFVLYLLHFGLQSNSLFIWCSTLFQFWLLGTLLVGSCISLTYSIIVAVFWGSVSWVFLFGFCHEYLIFGTGRCSRYILYISCPSPRTSHFSKEPYSFVGECY